MNRIFLTLITAGLISSGCSRNDTNSGLRESVENGVSKLNRTISKVSETKGYELLTIENNDLKTNYYYSDTINLSQIAGIYIFEPDTIIHSLEFPYKLFKKIDPSTILEISLPEKMVFHPLYLQNFEPSDSSFENNFKITVNNYRLGFNIWNSYDYTLRAEYQVDNEEIGRMDISTIYRSPKEYSKSSEYLFSDGYKISARWQDGDTASSAFFMTNNSDTLFAEKVTFIWKAIHKSEVEYSLKIGSVRVLRNSVADSTSIYLNGVLQKSASVSITDNSYSDISFCNRREIIITLDDGTRMYLSELMAPVKDQLLNMRSSLHSMYFARNIIDYIAYGIYYFPE